MPKYSAALLALYVTALFNTSAFAADPVIEEPLIPTAPEASIDTSQWGGFYLGLYGGYSWFTANASGLGEGDDNAARYGGYVGYNWQFDNQLITGLEALGGFNEADVVAGGLAVEQEWDASLRARLGYAFENSMIYSFAGLAVTSVDAVALTGADNQTLTGFNVGAGLEVHLFEDVTGRIEYGYDDYSDETFSLGGGAASNIDVENHSINLGVGLRF